MRRSHYRERIRMEFKTATQLNGVAITYKDYVNHMHIQNRCLHSNQLLP